MLSQMIKVTCRILVFRAGPQDLPYAPRYTAALVLFGAVANVAVFLQMLAPPIALAMAAGMVGGVALVTRSVLAARHMQNRYSQTFQAMLATGAVLTLLLVPPFAQIAPFLQQVAANPELLEHPETLNMPQGPVLLINLLNIWNFAVTAHIFRHAVEVRLAWGVLIALVAAFAVLFVVAFAGTLAGGIAGI